MDLLYHITSDKCLEFKESKCLCSTHHISKTCKDSLSHAVVCAKSGCLLMIPCLAPSLKDPTAAQFHVLWTPIKVKLCTAYCPHHSHNKLCITWQYRKSFTCTLKSKTANAGSKTNFIIPCVISNLHFIFCF
jgi:hypothetical protein